MTCLHSDSLLKKIEKQIRKWNKAKINTKVKKYIYMLNNILFVYILPNQLLNICEFFPYVFPVIKLIKNRYDN